MVGRGHPQACVPQLPEHVHEQALRVALAADDTVVVFDSHWFTTVEFVISAHGVRAGLFTSDELPRGMCRVP